MPEITVPDQDALILNSYDLTVPQQVNRSGWSGSSKVVGLPGAEIWSANVSIEDLATEASEWPWRAFFTGLRGRQNTFRLRMTCQQHYGPSPVVGAGAGDGYTLPLTGMAASTTILNAGQWLTVPLPNGHWRLVTLAADLATDASGNATAQFEPALNQVPTLSAAVETADPFMLVRLNANSVGMTYSQAAAGRAFDVEEAI